MIFNEELIVLCTQILIEVSVVTLFVHVSFFSCKHRRSEYGRHDNGRLV